MRRSQKTSRSTQSVDCPTAWFAALERARRIGDSDLASRAKRELNRLGVFVAFETPKAEVADDTE
jgi:hypothetical protein